MEEKNFNIYEHEKMLEVKKAHPEWVWNRGDTHIILGVPGSLEAFKTPVDPGNSFSPGPGTYGVSSWVYTDGVLYTPEEKNLEELKWEFENGYLPVVHSYWNAGKIAVHSTLFTDGDQEYSDYQDYFTVELTNISEEAKEVRFFLPVRSFGAAGGELRELSGTLDAVSVNGAVCLYAETPADRFGAVSFAKTQADISVFLRNGELPEETSVEDESTWASGAWLYEITLQPGKTVCYQFICHLHANHWIRQKWLKPLQRPFEIEAKKQKVLKEWQGYLGMQLDLPDCRFSDALRCQLTHLYMFTVDHDVRITPISYPLWWLRDGAYVLNALSGGGLFDFSAEACRKLAWKDTFGGFGSEGDGPSDGIWVMSEYYLLSRDQEFLKEMFPHMQRRAELLKQMRRTDKPMKRFTEMVIPKCMLDPNTDLMCLPARDGLIDGRMDHGFPIFWINSFAYLAFKRMAFCARELGLDDREYEQEAQEIREALYRLTEKGGFAHNDRDVNSAFWPGGWAERSNPDIIDGFDRYWREVRFRDGKHCPALAKNQRMG
ncbi:hypothetical protein H8702_00600 [Massilimaliae timonensis]|uniref:Alpha-L-rhamnosidase six-hairpin glycosidase domain-containing protein n=1 Tax=Massiliimalia timonensis TaxID=1987501 RepID=A0A8J6P246_9FIRM|nr:hypothetical protein [Massiliimalia timonensis]MBC8609618.1 hypothetical protein [Massiliimalia timonensis]